MYLLDTNIFIDANRLYYRMQYFPGFWDWIAHQNELAQVYSVEPVYQELKKGTKKDDVFRWCDNIKNRLFLQANSNAVQLMVRDLAAEVQRQKLPNKKISLPKYSSEVLEVFLECADPWLIAVAKIKGATVVTSEANKPSATSRVLIPVACDLFGVNWMPLYEFVNELGPNLVYERPGGKSTSDGNGQLLLPLQEEQPSA